MDFAVFSRQIPASKEVMCLILLNHLLTCRVFRHGFWGRARALLLVLDNDGMIWLWAQGQMSQWGCGKLTGGCALSLDLQNPRPSEAWTGHPRERGLGLVWVSPQKSLKNRQNQFFHMFLSPVLHCPRFYTKRVSTGHSVNSLTDKSSAQSGPI